MATQPYYNSLGKRLPSVTTVIGGNLGWNKEVLMRWAHRQGKEGIDFRETVAKACDAGTMAHNMVEEYVNGRDWRAPLELNKDFDGKLTHQDLESTGLEGLADMSQADQLAAYTLKVQALAKRSFSAFKRFEKSSGLVYVATEIPLVSEEWQFGGCLDAVATFEDEDLDTGEVTTKHTLLDWKTSNATYSDHLIQLAAYKVLWEEKYPDKPLTGGIWLARFSKVNGMVTTHNYPDGVLEPAWVAFSHLRAIHQQKWPLEAMTK